MPITTITDIARLIENDPWRMNILKHAAALDLPDWAIGAGFVRAAVWDALTGKAAATPLPDIDVIYFDRDDTTKDRDRALTDTLHQSNPTVEWDVKNQARMHIRNNDEPYRNTEEALSRWLETPTCIAAKLKPDGKVSILAPHGIDDLLALRVRPTLAGKSKPERYRTRMAEKNWPELWPDLQVEEIK